MSWNDDSWKDDYDSWKLASPDDNCEPEEECDCEESEIDWEGFATCNRCGKTWMASAEEIEADSDRSAAYDAYIRREEWKAWLLRPWRVLRSRLFPRKPLADNDIPF